MLVIPFMDAAAKFLEIHGHHLFQVAWLRFVGQLSMTLPICACAHGPRNTFVTPRRRHLLFGRGVLLLAATLSFFAAIQYLPLADTVAITFLEPCFLLILSRLVLKEQRVPLDRWIATAIGFGAVLLIVRPTSSSFQPASGFAILCTFFFSTFLLATRWLLKQPTPPPPLLLLAYQSMAGVLLLAPVTPFVWVPFKSAWHIAIAASMGAWGACAHLLIILAFDCAEASVLSPLLYAEILNQTVLGYAVFGDFPDGYTFAGVAIIIAVGMYITIEQPQRKPKLTGAVSSTAASSDGASVSEPAAAERQSCSSSGGNAGISSSSSVQNDHSSRLDEPPVGSEHT